jgi:mono/diheme cytochrome c family protein
MKLCRTLFCGVVGAVFITAKLFAAGVASTNNVVTSPPVYVPDTSHANEPMPDGVLAWNSLMQNTNAAADQAQAHFFFSFTNIATVPSVNFLTNAEGVTAITNTTPVSVTILDVHPSCGCTTVELPPRPWTIPPGGHGEFGVTVNLEGKIGTLLKAVTVSTDKGSKDLLLRITILPPVIPNMTDADRARGVEMSKADRQAVFKDDCATCHVKPGDGKYGKALFDSVCAVCHETEHRATMVPDLHNLKVPTNDEFWRTWIAHGKAGSLMPAFSSAEGGPLNDMQIASLAAYLNYAIPSHVMPAQ